MQAVQEEDEEECGEVEVAVTRKKEETGTGRVCL
jgi:hypothetical protein